MRELKFRAWDLDNYQMYYQDRDNDSGEGPIIWSCSHGGLFFEEPTPIPWYDPDRIEYRRPNQEVMQYTGLKDKNGKEIYEGDVISDGKVNAPVQWNDIGAWSWEHGEDWGMIFEEDVEVIGNIYENPEQLLHKPTSPSVD